jgi:hypothetical protein
MSCTKGVYYKSPHNIERRETMGLDMYAYSVPEADVVDDFAYKKDSPNVKRIAYWRKHHDLHGWMTRLWMSKVTVASAVSKGINALTGLSDANPTPDDFNCTPVRLTLEDLAELREDVVSDNLPATNGFFFGDNPPDEETKAEDIKFIEDAAELIKNGHAVYYNSWW